MSLTEKITEIYQEIQSFKIEHIIECDIKLASEFSDTHFYTVVSMRQSRHKIFCLLKRRDGSIQEKNFLAFFSTKEQCKIIDYVKQL